MARTYHNTPVTKLERASKKESAEAPTPRRRLIPQIPKVPKKVPAEAPPSSCPPKTHTSIKADAIESQNPALSPETIELPSCKGPQIHSLYNTTKICCASQPSPEIHILTCGHRISAKSHSPCDPNCSPQSAFLPQRRLVNGPVRFACALCKMAAMVEAYERIRDECEDVVGRMSDGEMMASAKEKAKMEWEKEIGEGAARYGCVVDSKAIA